MPCNVIKNLPSCVIQDNVNGFHLFQLYVNEVVDLFSGGVVSKLHVDDVKLCNTVEPDANRNQLQLSLNIILEWSKIWQINISFNKFDIFLACLSIILLPLLCNQANHCNHPVSFS